MPQELRSSKCREWEKERRNRLNDAFTTLCKLLPSYDPAKSISKIIILQTASTHIEELQNKIKTIITSENEEDVKKIKGDEVKKLQERVKKLLIKNEQLCSLLRDAKITIPQGCAFVKKFRNPHSWSQKISPEQAKLFQKKEAEKENVAADKNLGKKIKNKNKGSSTPKHRKAILNRSEVKKLKNGKRKKVVNKSLASSKCVIVFSQPSISQPCYVITNAPSNSIIRNTSTVITNSGLLTNPLMSSNTKTNPKTVPSIPQLASGTLILANGTIMPVLQQQTVLPIINSVPLNTRAQNSTVILLPSNALNLQNNTTQHNKVVVTSSGAKSVVKIRPKYCLTKTTQVNKVPIPALTSRYANNDLMLNTKNANKLNNNNSNKTLEKRVIAVNNINKGGDKGSQQTVKPSDCPEKRKLSNETEVEAKKGKLDERIDKMPSADPQNKESDNKKDTIEKDKSEAEKIIEEKIQEINKKQVSPPEKEKPIQHTVSEVVKDKILQTAKGHTEKTNNETPESVVTRSKPLELQSEPETKKHDDLDLNINHSELSNDIFASLHVPTGCQNPESTSPTAAFLLAFPLVSSLTGVKVTEVTEDDNNDSHSGTPTLLQIGTMESTKPTQSQSESLTPSLLNLDNLSFFSSKDISGFYNSFENNLPAATTTVSTTTSTSNVISNPQINLNQVVPSIQPVQQKMAPKLNYQQRKTDLGNCFGSDNSTVLVNNNNNSFNSSLNENLVNYQVKTKNNVKNVDNKQTCALYTPQKSYNSYNNFNDLSKVSAAVTVCSYSTAIKSYPDPLYTNSNTYNYNYPTDTNFNQNYYKTINKNDNNRNYYSLSYENYTDYKKNDATVNTNYYANNVQMQNKDKFPGNSTNMAVGNNKIPKNAPVRPPINWMTTPDTRLQSSNDILPSFSKENDFGHNTFYPNSQTYSAYSATTINNNTVNNQEIRKPTLDLPLVTPMNTNTYQRNDIEENQFSWSPTKIPQFLDPPHNFVSSTLPTLVGDLALGNPLTFADQKADNSNKCQSKRDSNNRRVKNYDGNQSNFLSVSQLVDHSKNEPVPARTTNRRNSGNRSNKKVPQPKSSQTRNNKTQETNQSSNNNNNNNNKLEAVGVINNKTNQMKQQMNSYCADIFGESNNKNNRLPPKTNYSAEALIGRRVHQNSDLTQKNRQNYPEGVNKSLPVPSFLADNIIPYFPPVDLQQTDNNYMQQNQNFGHNFPSTFQNNSYSANTFIATATTITSTYLGTNNFMPDMSGTAHDYGDNLNLFASNKDKGCNSKSLNRGVQQNLCPVSTSAQNNKKPKRKHSNEANLPGFDFPFLSMPASINSPILPDDFHAHSGFLQPPTPQLYPSKNPLYSKQNDLASSSLLPLPPVPGTRNSIQHPEISPSLNSAGTSLTNFNLSTIFPEINKSAQLDSYNEPRIKDHSVRSYSSGVQVSLNEKAIFNFNYINCPTTQTYNNQI